MSDDLRFDRVIDASPMVVFEAFTTPGGQEAFYGQDDPGWIVESACDLRVGGVWAVTFGRREITYTATGTASRSSNVRDGSSWPPRSSGPTVRGSTSRRSSSSLTKTARHS